MSIETLPRAARMAEVCDSSSTKRLKPTWVAEMEPTAKDHAQFALQLQLDASFEDVAVPAATAAMTDKDDDVKEISAPLASSKSVGAKRSAFVFDRNAGRFKTPKELAALAEVAAAVAAPVPAVISTAPVQAPAAASVAAAAEPAAVPLKPVAAPELTASPVKVAKPKEVKASDKEIQSIVKACKAMAKQAMEQKARNETPLRLTCMVSKARLPECFLRRYPDTTAIGLPDTKDKDGKLVQRGVPISDIRTLPVWKASPKDVLISAAAYPLVEAMFAKLAAGYDTESDEDTAEVKTAVEAPKSKGKSKKSNKHSRDSDDTSADDDDASAKRPPNKKQKLDATEMKAVISSLAIYTAQTEEGSAFAAQIARAAGVKPAAGASAAASCKSIDAERSDELKRVLVSYMFSVEGKKQTNALLARALTHVSVAVAAADDDS